MFNPALKDASFQKNSALAFEALDTDISSQPHHLPLIAAAGMLLLEMDYIAQFYLHYHTGYHLGRWRLIWSLNSVAACRAA